MTTDSYIRHFDGGTTYAGNDAVRLFQARAIRSALNLNVKAGLLPRGISITKVLAAATRITQQPYGRGTAAKMSAVADLDQWIAAMEAALPIHGGQS